MISLKTLPGLALLVCAASCGGSDARDSALAGSRALGKNDYTTAVSQLDRALAELDPSSDASLKARLDRCRALAHLDAPRAKEDLLALLETGKVQYGHYSIVVEDFADAKAWPEAVAVLEAGKVKLPNEPKMEDLLQEIGKQAENSGADAATMDALKGLGYVGN